MSILGFLACIAIGKLLSALADQPIWRRLAAGVVLAAASPLVARGSGRHLTVTGGITRRLRPASA